MKLPTIIAAVAVGLLGLAPLRAQRQLEALSRGVIAINQGAGKVHVSWRLLGQDADELAFNLYRSTAGGAPVKLNAAPLTRTTDFVDTTADTTKATSYFVRPALLDFPEQAASAAFTLPANAPARPYLSVPLQVPANGTTPDGLGYAYNANDASVGDLDGDGDYEIVLKWDPTNSKDNSQSGYTGNVYLDAYTLDGTRLWRIDLGRNIRAGAHYTQFMVYDLDGDGRAEIACKTADGTIDGTGRVIGDANADYRNSAGYVLTGPEFLTIFDGRTGAALTTTNYLPARNNDPTSSNVSAWGDNYGNRVDRFLACVAYLDGQRPSLVMCRGYYTRATLVAYDWRDGHLTRRWMFDSDDGTPGNSAYRGQGAHSLTVGDVDNDGRDEIIYGAAAIDDDGHALYSTRLGHGDALHMSDMNPEHPGQEIWMVHEDPASYGPTGLEQRDAKSGALLLGVDGQNADIGRGVAYDIDPRYRGYEMWGARGGLYAADGRRISTSRPSQMNFAVWWDADLLRETLDGTTISKWNWNTNSSTTLLSATGCSSNNSTKSNPCLSADILGDWREEVIWRTNDSSELRIYTTTIPAENRLTTLMHDSQYRVAVAWQNVAYNQPPHPSFYLGDGMARPPLPLMRTAADRPSDTRLINLSVRTNVGSGADSLLVGFYVAGTGRPQVLVRGIGPALTAFGVANALSDPRLDLFADGAVLATSNDWSEDTSADSLASASASLGAFPLPRPGRDAALFPVLAAGSYSVQLSPASGGRGVALVELYAGATARLLNASALALAGAGNDTLIAGFVISGPASKTVLIRAVGPALAAFGVSRTLADPHLSLFRGTTLIASNDDWSNGSGATPASFAAHGAFALADGSKDAALLLTLPPGTYSAQASGNDGANATVLIEIYALDH